MAAVLEPELDRLVDVPELRVSKGLFYFIGAHVNPVPDKLDQPGQSVGKDLSDTSAFMRLSGFG